MDDREVGRPQKPSGGWGGLGAMVGFGSVGAVIGVIFLASFIHVATERARGLGAVVAGTAALV